MQSRINRGSDLDEFRALETSGRRKPQIAKSAVCAGFNLSE
jgi:hypothetical protein